MKRILRKYFRKKNDIQKKTKQNKKQNTKWSMEEIAIENFQKKEKTEKKLWLKLL